MVGSVWGGGMTPTDALRLLRQSRDAERGALGERAMLPFVLLYCLTNRRYYLAVNAAIFPLGNFAELVV